MKTNVMSRCTSEKPDEYADFNDLGYWSTLFKSGVAICVFFSWVKLFKYISFNKDSNNNINQ